MEVSSESEFIKAVFQLINEEPIFGDSVKTAPVVQFKHPDELESLINFSVDKPVENLEELVDVCRKIIKYSVKTSHPHFYNQLYAGVDLFGLAGTWMTEALNTNQHTYEIAPAFALAENAILKHVQKVFAIQNGDGIFAPGGSISNMYGIVLARYHKFPDVKTKGIQALPKLICFTSEDSHYSIKKSCHWLGLGTDNLVKVKCDDFGRMLPGQLEIEIMKAINQGFVPFFVNATVGTTVLGAIDPLDKIADVCLKYNVWLHVDACFGGTLMLSAKFSDRLKGIERCDSFAWNPHKMLGAPLQCAIFITSHQNLLHECNSASATYLFQQDKFYDVSYDTGDKSVQCGRKVDAFKLWVMWKARGDQGFEERINKMMECARFFKERISKTEGFRLIMEEFDLTCICFYYIPEKMRNQIETERWKEKLYKVAPRMKEKMILSGTIMIGYSPLESKGLGNFWRMVVTANPPPTFDDMEYVIQKIIEFGKDLD